MADSDSIEQKSVEKDYTTVQSTEELDKLDDKFGEEDDSSSLLLALLAIIPMAILFILFSL